MEKASFLLNGAFFVLVVISTGGRNLLNPATPICKLKKISPSGRNDNEERFIKTKTACSNEQAVSFILKRALIILLFQHFLRYQLVVQEFQFLEFRQLFLQLQELQQLVLQQLLQPEQQSPEQQEQF
jgi:hypothetical protein